MSSVPLSAAILAGGQSSRMGRDKALIDVGGQPVIRRVVDAARCVSSDVRIVGYKEAYRMAGVEVVPDDAPGYGPLGGIMTALRQAEHEFVLVLACDIPLVSTQLLRAMAKEPRSYDALVPALTDDEGSIRYEPLHAIYSVTCLPVIETLISDGDIRIQHLFERLNTSRLNERWLRSHDRTLDSFVNMNTPAELERVRSRLTDGS